MNFLSIFFPVASLDMAPLSLVYKHRIASATATDRSLPVGQQIRISPISSGREEKKEDSSGRCVLRSRDPSFPVPQGRFRYLFFICSGFVVVSGLGVQLITVLKGLISRFWLEETCRLAVGLTSIGTAFGPFSSFRRSAINSGSSPSLVVSSISLFGQNSLGIRPCDHASSSSAAPWMYPSSEPSLPYTRLDAVHRTTGWKSAKLGGVSGREDDCVTQRGRRGFRSFC